MCSAGGLRASALAATLYRRVMAGNVGPASTVGTGTTLLSAKVLPCITPFTLFGHAGIAATSFSKGRAGGGVVLEYGTDVSLNHACGFFLLFLHPSTLPLLTGKWGCLGV